MTKLLILEDEALFGCFLEDYLSKTGTGSATGFNVVWCVDFWEAQNAFDHAAKSGAPFDVVLSDLNNPGETQNQGGRDLMEHVRKSNPDFPVILMTADPQQGKAVLASNPLFLGIELVSKPFPLKDLDAAIARALPVAPGGGRAEPDKRPQPI